MSRSKMFELLNNEFTLPFQPFPFQERIITEAAKFRNVLLPLRVGAGKTYISTCLGLWLSIAEDVSQLFFIVPAPLVTQWGRWLEEIQFSDGTLLDTLVYAGPPKKRAQMNFEHDCVVMSRQIFVRDYHKKILKELGKRSDVFVVYDEAHQGLRKVNNTVWRLFKNFTINKRSVLLSGTPVSTPMDSYAVIKLLDPTVYPTKRKFEQEHVQDRDFFGNVTEWKNLELLNARLYANAVEMEDGEMVELPGLTVEPIQYALAPGHKRLYDKLVKEELLKTDNGQVIDATETTRMFHILQRFVTSPDRMDLKKVQVQLLKLVLQIYNEDDSKLVIMGNYRDTNDSILEFLISQNITTVGVWGKHTRKQQEQAKDAFMHDADVRVTVGNPESLGVGTDGLQKVCYRILFTELPLTPARFEQACGRLDRPGQTQPVIAKCLMAEGTIQENLYWSLLKKNDLLQEITRGQLDIREILT